MKSIFISFNQALSERVMTILDRHGSRGFTKWELTLGRGSHTGEPHLANHTWPAMNSSVLTIVEDEQVSRVMDALRELDKQTQMQGLRAYVWNVEDQL